MFAGAPISMEDLMNGYDEFITASAISSEPGDFEMRDSETDAEERLKRRAKDGEKH